MLTMCGCFVEERVYLSWGLQQVLSRDRKREGQRNSMARCRAVQPSCESLLHTSAPRLTNDRNINTMTSSLTNASLLESREGGRGRHRKWRAVYPFSPKHKLISVYRQHAQKNLEIVCQATLSLNIPKILEPEIRSNLSVYLHCDITRTVIGKASGKFLTWSLQRWMI